MKIEDIENREDEKSFERKEPVRGEEDSFDNGESVSDIPHSKLSDKANDSKNGDGTKKTNGGGRPRPTNLTPLP